jgi:F-type H+-transporting ATPase subunit a
MDGKRVKSLWVVAFSVLTLCFSIPGLAQQHGDESEANKEAPKEEFDANEVIFGHVLDAHEFHFFSYKGSDGVEHHGSISLPIILYSPTRHKFSVFSSARFHHGHETYDGYKMEGNKVLPVDEAETVFDFSLTRNVVQMVVALILLVWIMTSIAKKYQKGEGVTTAPSGFQNAVEPVITFVRDEVGKPNLGSRYTWLCQCCGKYRLHFCSRYYFLYCDSN